MFATLECVQLSFLCFYGIQIGIGTWEMGSNQIRGFTYFHFQFHLKKTISGLRYRFCDISCITYCYISLSCVPPVFAWLRYRFCDISCITYCYISRSCVPPVFAWVRKLRGLPYMTSAVGGGGGHQKADKRNKISWSVTLTRGEGVKKSKNFADNRRTSYMEAPNGVAMLDDQSSDVSYVHHFISNRNTG